MNQKKIGKFIYKLRKDKKMTQQELANKLYVTDRAVSHWENGRSIPDITLFKPLCEIFDITVNELISGEKLPHNKLISQSEENIINALEDNKKNKRNSKNIIITLTIGILILLTLFLIGINQKYPKIDIFNFMVQQLDGEALYKLEEKLKYKDRNIYYYGLNSALLCDKNEKCYSINDAIEHNQITLNDLQDYLDIQVKYDNFKVDIMYDSGTKIYHKENMQIMYCNTLDGNKDVYIGNDKMVSNLRGEYCGHQRNKDESYIRTYKVLSSNIDKDNNEFNIVKLEQNNGVKGVVSVNNSNNLIPGHTYEFLFLTFDKFEDTIENIFNNSTLLEIIETDKIKEEQINEKIIVNDSPNSSVELNELEHVSMSIISGSLTRISAKVKITDLSNKKYIYGFEYKIEKKIEGKWKELKYKNPTGFNSMAYFPDKNGNLIFDINWFYMYGRLDNGEYRIIKSALINNKGCNPICKHYYFSVEFDIK